MTTSHEVAAPDEVYAAYHRVPDPIPDRALAWNVYGVGLESVGRDGQPESVPVPGPADDQLLIRVDAVGLCFSDIKLLRLGGNHPKLYGRDLSVEPTRLGHETSVTVVAVGESLRDRFRPGQRLAIQPDIYVGGYARAYGYTVPGGMIQFHVIGPEVLAADDGAYVVEVPDTMGYAETALTEPWACVEASYTQRRRLEPLAGGRTWIAGSPDDDRAWEFGPWFAQAASVVLSGASAALEARVRAAAPGVPITHDEGAAEHGPFDDIILLGITDAAAISRAGDALAFRGLLNLVGDELPSGPIDLDVGRIHYHYTAWVGTSGLDVGAAYGEAHNRCELRPGGVAVVVGAAGPMGQMHAERALALANGPRLVVAVDLDEERLAVARRKLEPVAAKSGRPLVVRLLGREPDALQSLVAELTDGRGADDVIVTAPSVAAITAGAAAMAPDGMLVLFAGVPVGTRATLDLANVIRHGAQLTGTSGSRIADQALVVAKASSGELAPRRALAAVGGIEAARDALAALQDGRFPGKIVLFPQLTGLPLTGLDELRRDPEFAAVLDSDGSWTTEAEALLFSRHWQRETA